MAHQVLVEVLEGKIAAGAKDSYCVVASGDVKKKTQVITKSANPKWKEKFELVTNGDIKISLWAKGKAIDDNLGTAEFKIDAFLKQQKGQVEASHPILKKNAKTADVKIRFTYVKAVDAPPQETKAEKTMSESGEGKQVAKMNFNLQAGTSNSVRSSLSDIASSLNTSTPTNALATSGSHSKDNKPVQVEADSGMKKSLAFSDKFLLKQTVSQFDLAYKVVVVGDSGVGKTNIFHRFDRNKFSPNFISTVGADFSTKMYKLPNSGKVVKVQVWDTAGQERFQTVCKQYYRGSAGAIIVYDVTNEDSFKNVEEWMKQLELNSQNDAQVLLLLGNKADLEGSRKVKESDGRKFAAEHRLDFYEVSALSGLNIAGAIQCLLCKICKINNDDKGESRLSISEKTVKEQKEKAKSSNLGPSTANQRRLSTSSSSKPLSTSQNSKSSSSSSSSTTDESTSPSVSPRLTEPVGVTSLKNSLFAEEVVQIQKENVVMGKERSVKPVTPQDLLEHQAIPAKDENTDHQTSDHNQNNDRPPEFNQMESLLPGDLELVDSDDENQKTQNEQEQERERLRQEEEHRRQEEERQRQEEERRRKEEERRKQEEERRKQEEDRRRQEEERLRREREQEEKQRLARKQEQEKAEKARQQIEEQRRQEKAAEQHQHQQQQEQNHLHEHDDESEEETKDTGYHPEDDDEYRDDDDDGLNPIAHLKHPMAEYTSPKSTISVEVVNQPVQEPPKSECPC